MSSTMELRRGPAAPTWPVAVPRPSRAPLALVIAVTGVLGLVLGLAPGGGAPVAPAATAPDACGASWATAWQTAPQAAPDGAGLDGTTLRLVVQPQVAGTEVRVRLSNAYGATPLVVGRAAVARSAGGAAVEPGGAALSFGGGRPTVEVPAGGAVTSDAVPLTVEAGRALAVSLHLPVVPDVLTRHDLALQTSYRSGPGDAVLAGAAAFPTALGSWPFLTGVDVLAPRPVRAVVAVGDSLTDGVGSAPDADQRWPDALAARLPGATAVLNAGISANRLLVDDPDAGGDAPLTRFDRDTAAAAGATDVVLHAGTNDLADGSTAEEVVAGLRRYAERARASGHRVFLTTITPATHGAHGTPAAVAERDAVNAWVRAHGREHADGVFDFAAAVADPDRPSRLAPAYDAGDGLHLSAAGYRALAAAVDPAALTGSPCPSDVR